jgi:tetratricopeptide (TPR) repeat protein
MAKKKPHIQLKSKLDSAGEVYPHEMRRLLTLGKPKEDMDYAEWAERLRDYVPQLIKMTLDDDLNHRPEKDRAVWAPLHALSILAELAPVEAAEPLLKVFEGDNDWTDELLPRYYAGVGAPAAPILKRYALDTSHDHFARGGAVAALEAIANADPSARDDIVHFLVEMLDRDTDDPDEEYVITTAVLALTDLRAVEALPAIEAAFEKDRVETFMVAQEDVRQAFGLAEATGEAEATPKGVKLSLKCLVCGREREYAFDRAYYDASSAVAFDDPAAMSRALYTPEPVVCRRCGAVEQYELGQMGNLTVTAAMAGRLGGNADILPGLMIISFPPAPWGWLPPREALARYQAEIATQPTDLALRVDYADALAAVGEHAASIEQFEQALLVDPLSGNAAIGLADVMADQGEIADAILAWERVERDLDSLQFLDNDEVDRDELRELARRKLSYLRAGERPPRGIFRDLLAEKEVEELGLAQSPGLLAAPPAPWPTQGPEFVTPQRGEYGKVGRNEPCPCGSGKKYKQCHGRK